MDSATADTMMVTIVSNDAGFDKVLDTIDDLSPDDPHRYDMEALIFERLAAKAHKVAKELRHG